MELRKRWISLISRKDFTPTKGHRVCSEHFRGGQKTSMNNLPVIVPKTTRPTVSKPRSITKSRNRDPNVQWKSASRNGNHKLEGNTSNAAERESDNGDEVAALKAQFDSLNLKHEEEMEKAQQKISLLQTENKLMKEKTAKISFPLRAKNDCEKLHFDTGLNDYETFKIL